MASLPLRFRVGPFGIGVLTALAVVGIACSAAETSSESFDQNDPGSLPGSEGQPTVSGGAPAELIRVVDGDSLEMTIAGEDVDVRLENYNAPEALLPDDRPSCHGEASTVALAELLEGRQLSVIGEENDRFGRLLVELLADGESVVDLLIAEGHGLALFEDDGRREAMKASAEARLGLWGDRCGTPATQALEIGDAQPNPPGPDGEVLAEEWLEIENRSGEPVDLAGWVIRDHTTSNRFTLDGRLDAGSRLRVRTGEGTDTEADRYLGEQFPVWSNEDETVLLVDPDGVVTDWLFLD